MRSNDDIYKSLYNTYYILMNVEHVKDHDLFDTSVMNFYDSLINEINLTMIELKPLEDYYERYEFDGFDCLSGDRYRAAIDNVKQFEFLKKNYEKLKEAKKNIEKKYNYILFVNF